MKFFVQQKCGKRENINTRQQSLRHAPSSSHLTTRARRTIKATPEAFKLCQNPSRRNEYSRHIWSLHKKPRKIKTNKDTSATRGPGQIST